MSRYYTVDVPILAVPPMGGLPGQDESEMYVGTEGACLTRLLNDAIGACLAAVGGGVGRFAPLSSMMLQ